MTYVERSFDLRAETGLGRYPRPELIGPLLTHLPGTLKDSVRLGFLHASRPSGRLPEALEAATEVRFSRVQAEEDGGCSLVFRVPRLGDAVPALFQQGSFWNDLPSAESTAFELLDAALQDVAAGRADSDHFDQPFLKHLGVYQRALKSGIRSIQVSSSASVGTRLDAELIQAARNLAAVTPSPRRVRVAGRLDLMGASQGVLKLHAKSGVVVTALWTGSDPIDRFNTLFNRDVVIEGLGVFRPSGALLRVEADAVVPAGVQDEFFFEVPTATPARDYLKLARPRIGESSSYAKLQGFVPAEESDEAFLEALERIR